MTILDTIIKAKLIEVAHSKQRVPHKQLEQALYFSRKTISMKAALCAANSSGVIAEFKRKSPSKGAFKPEASTSEICPGYQHAGAAALSILTDQEFFGGKLTDLTTARELVSIPILRKEFIVDAYQIAESKAAGADAILLIASAISVEQTKEFTALAHSLHLEVLLEVHSSEELSSHYLPEIDLIGVNNRNLKTFVTDVSLSRDLAKVIPDSSVKVAESGISDPNQVRDLREHGYRGFLIGETFMSNSDPIKSCANFIGRIA